jgi:hypothetical protein
LQDTLDLSAGFQRFTAFCLSHAAFCKILISNELLMRCICTEMTARVANVTSQLQGDLHIQQHATFSVSLHRHRKADKDTPPMGQSGSYPERHGKDCLRGAGL